MNTGETRRRRWSVEERAGILAESFEPGANVSAVARRHGINGNLLHYWRKQARKQSFEAGAPDAPLFVPVSIAEATGAAGLETSPRPLPLDRMIEIEIRGALVRVPAGVDGQTLSMVLASLRRIS
ncbi:IS66-like element accessory protein TnpA [Methylocapsa aurea]|uniref:IS66-like element accessory protein TnpA n=1 Tax=Methylocapsa aurea TaxID=663610 RepID=UPI003D18FAA0